MKRALGLALAAMMVLPAVAAAQDEEQLCLTVTTTDPVVGSLLGSRSASMLPMYVKKEITSGNLEILAVVPCGDLAEEPVAEEPATAEEPVATAAKPVKVSGKGSKNTQPFMLAAGDYRVTLSKAKNCDQFTYGYLKHAAGDYSPSGEVAQDGYIYGVEEGRHYWDAEADNKCKWAYVLTSLE